MNSHIASSLRPEMFQPQTLNCPMALLHTHFNEIPHGFYCWTISLYMLRAQLLPQAADFSERPISESVRTKK